MRIFIISLFFICISSVSNAQVSIQLQEFNGINFSSSDAVNCIITSNLEESISVFLEVQIASEKGAVIAMLKTRPFKLNRGVNLYSKQNLQIDQKKYLNRDFGLYEQSNGYLPAASYSYCLSLRCADENCFNIPTEWPIEKVTGCIDINIINPTPLFLSSPFDEASIDTKRPNFNWIPPMPIGNDPNLTYQFTLVELRERQSGESAIRRNRPMYRSNGLRQINLIFPPELEDLKIETEYAWQVQAFLGKTVIQTSDVWTFSIPEDEDEVLPMPSVLLKKTDNQIYNAVNELKFIYKQEGISKDLKYTITLLDGTDLQLNLNDLSLKFGENAFVVNLKDLNLEHKQYYILKVTTDKREVYRLKFKYFFRK
ncbi:MAG: hypothetical protein COA58_13455 [Bacteroidetes bacterium]|nr:MAG: hypothetical protein COA58_13455 [Bacteroidota bacterium]